VAEWWVLTDFMTASAPTAQLHWLLLNDREAREKEPSMMIIGCDFHPSKLGPLAREIP
jgi:hypothetical protein